MPWVPYEGWKGEDPTVEELQPVESDRKCACCEARGVTLKVYKISGLDPRYEACFKDHVPPFECLCVLCANTLASVSTAYRYNDARIQRTACFVGNMILKELREIKAQVNRLREQGS